METVLTNDRTAGRLTAALSAEHTAIWVYGRIGVLLDKADQEVARTAEAQHRDRRDGLLDVLAELGVDAPAAQPGYTLPYQVTSAATALALAAFVEDGVAATWRAGLADTESGVRRFVLTGYTDAAVQAMRWRRAAGLAPLTETYPGRPD